MHLRWCIWKEAISKGEKLICTLEAESFRSSRHIKENSSTYCINSLRIKPQGSNYASLLIQKGRRWAGLGKIMWCTLPVEAICHLFPTAIWAHCLSSRHLAPLRFARQNSTNQIHLVWYCHWSIRHCGFACNFARINGC